MKTITQQILNDVELPKEFAYQMDKEEGPDDLYIMKEAPWLQMDNEDNDEYVLFKFYLGQPNAYWDIQRVYDSAVIEGDIDDLPLFGVTEWQDISEKHNWYVRRYSFIRYKEFMQRKRDESFQLEMLREFRNTQAQITSEAAVAAYSLLGKVTSRIDNLLPEEIDVKQLPNFLRAVSEILEVAADAEARVLSIGALMDMYSEEIDDKIVQKHEELIQKYA